MAHPDTEAAVAEADTDATDNSPSVEETYDLASFYEDDPEDPAVEPDEPQDDTDDEDEPDEAPEDDEAEAEEPPIGAPVSLKAEHKELFAQLPAEAQRAMSEIISQRDRDVQSGLESAREAQRNAERAAADHTAQTQRFYADQLEAVVNAFRPTPPSPDLARQDPAAYQYQRAVFEEENANFQQIMGHVQQERSAAGQHDQLRTREWADAEMKKLMSVPEFANEETRAETVQNIVKFAAEHGFSQEEMNQADARDIMLLNKAAKWKADAEKWQAHQRKRNERPRTARGKFASAPVNKQPTKASSDPLDILYGPET